MAVNAHDAGRWTRSQPRRALPAHLVERAVRTAFPRGRVLDVQPLGNGFRNANFKVQLDCAPEFLVLRVYEHDPPLCQKELDLIRLVAGSVPVAEVLHAEPRGLEDLPPFALLGYVAGITFRELKRDGDVEGIRGAARSAGETLAAIGRFTFPKSGWLAPGPVVKAPLLEGADPLPRFIDLCLASPNLQKRLQTNFRSLTHDLIWSWAPQLGNMEDECRLVHCDFGERNLLVRNVAGRWSVAAVLDWEFAVSGSPLIDLGHFLRDERAQTPVLEPHFSRGYSHAGGRLQTDWRQLARLFDLAALCEMLTRDQLPDDIAAELVELAQATAKNRDRELL